MSYPINQKMPQYQQNQPAMGLNNPQLQPQGQPAMGVTVNTQPLQNVNADTVTQGITQNSVLKGVSGSENEENSWITPVLTIPVGAGMIYGMDKFNKACKGNYEESLVYKARKLGDTIATKLPFIDRLAEQIGINLNKLDEKFVSKSRILSAFFHAPSKPTNSMVLTMAGGSKSELASDAVSKLQQYLKLGGTLKGANGETLDKTQMLTELEDLSTKFHTKDGLARIVEICRHQGVGEEASTQARQFINLKNIPFIGKRLFKDDKYLSDIITPLRSFGRKVYFSEYVNKIEAFTNLDKKVIINGVEKAPTFLGKFFPQAMIRGLEGLTNGTAGGKIAVLMAAYFVADAIKKGIDAPSGNGEKRKTIAENLFYNTGWYLTMPLGIKIMHSIGGLQYIGMGKGKDVIQSNLKEYRTKLEEFNNKALGKDSKGNICEAFKSKEEYKAADKELSKLLKGDSGISLKSPKSWKNIVYKPLRAIGRILTVGLEAKRPYLASANAETILGKSLNFAKTLPYHLKKVTGYPMRFGVFMFLIAPPLAKIAAQFSHFVFGKPTKSVLDEEKETEKDKALPPLIMPAQQDQAVAQQSGTASVMQPVATQKGENLIDNKSADSSRATIATPKEKEPVRRYIPSSDPVRIDPNVRNPKDEKLNAVINKSMAADRAACKFIPGEKHQ